MKYLKKFESIFNIADIEIGSQILYKGSQYKVINKDDFSVTILDEKLGKRKKLKLEDINQYGIFNREK